LETIVANPNEKKNENTMTERRRRTGKTHPLNVITAWFGVETPAAGSAHMAIAVWISSNTNPLVDLRFLVGRHGDRRGRSHTSGVSAQWLCNAAIGQQCRLQGAPFGWLPREVLSAIWPEAGYTGLPISYVAPRGRVTSRGRDMVPGKDFHMALSQGRNDAGA
jgi:hypothetical protein